LKLSSAGRSREGHYSTEDEVVADALRLMQARDEVGEIKRVRLKDAIDRGYQDAVTGKVIRLESADQPDRRLLRRPVRRLEFTEIARADLKSIGTRGS